MEQALFYNSSIQCKQNSKSACITDRDYHKITLRNTYLNTYGYVIHNRNGFNIYLIIKSAMHLRKDYSIIGGAEK